MFAISYTFAARMGGDGTVHSYAGDTYTVNYTSGGKAYALTGTI